MVYLPVGGEVFVRGVADKGPARWFDPRRGELHVARGVGEGAGIRFAAPVGGGERPWNWVLVCLSADPGK